MHLRTNTQAHRVQAACEQQQRQHHACPRHRLECPVAKRQLWSPRGPLEKVEDGGRSLPDGEGRGLQAVITKEGPCLERSREKARQVAQAHAAEEHDSRQPVGVSAHIARVQGWAVSGVEQDQGPRKSISEHA